jgi:hypothetical protein
MNMGPEPELHRSPLWDEPNSAANVRRRGYEPGPGEAAALRASSS